MKQYLITPSTGKRLIARALAKHPTVKSVLQKGTLVIIAGTTNGYVAEEVLAATDQVEGFSRLGFRRGLVAPPGFEVPEVEFPGDVVIRDGKWIKGLTIFDVVDDLRVGDLVLKGGNAFDPRGQAAVHIGSETGGTIIPTLAALVGRRVQLIVPIGLEKRVFEDVNDLALLCNHPDAEGLRLMPIPGVIFTEIDAVHSLTGTEATLISAGGIYSAEGAVRLGITGSQTQIEKVAKIIEEIQDEPLCEV